MLLTILDDKTPHGSAFPARSFAAYDERPSKDKNTVEITLSREQAVALADWLNEQIYGVKLKGLYESV